MSHIGTTNLFWTGTVLWVVLWAIFVIRLAWLDARLRAHVTEHHPHRWRRLSWSQRLTWSVGIVDIKAVWRRSPGPWPRSP
jgi:hypothetical protein